MNFLTQINDPLFLIFISGFAFLLVFLVVPSIIHVADQRKLFDKTDLIRKTHRHGISRLGGIAVFCSLILTTLLFTNFTDTKTSDYLLISFILLFAVGIKDDLWGVNTSTKFFIQLLTALTIVILADIRITNMHGILGFHAISYSSSLIFSTILIIFITNSFNLIDGIDGLVGITGLVVSVSFGIFLIVMGKHGFACLAFTVAGACLGFLKFNVSPARIFMGDAGSTLIGLVASILAITFTEANIGVNLQPARFVSAPAIAIAILIGPIFDVLRVFTIRIFNRKSPFVADLNHTHHRLLRTGLNHFQTALVLVSFNNFLIAIVISLRDWGNIALIGFLLTCCILFNIALSFILIMQQRKDYKSVSSSAILQT
jgi:UDP-N-acetylmuramyl pentapeptide phosphotransferase/UDP-N-acetylglucosamine-1-phosphate transferase